jgi:hypothetical protein
MADAIATALAKVSIAEGGWNLIIDATFFMDVFLFYLLLVKLHGAKYA